MNKLTSKFKVGKAVVFLPTGERGEITSVNDAFVFCKFWRHWGFGSPKACNPSDLRLNEAKNV